MEAELGGLVERCLGGEACEADRDDLCELVRLRYGLEVRKVNASEQNDGLDEIRKLEPREAALAACLCVAEQSRGATYFDAMDDAGADDVATDAFPSGDSTGEERGLKFASVTQASFSKEELDELSEELAGINAALMEVGQQSSRSVY